VRAYQPRVIRLIYVSSFMNRGRQLGISKNVKVKRTVSLPEIFDMCFKRSRHYTKCTLFMHLFDGQASMHHKSIPIHYYPKSKFKLISQYDSARLLLREISMSWGLWNYSLNKSMAAGYKEGACRSDTTLHVVLPIKEVQPK